MGAHIIDGEFQSDKYPTTPRGKVPLSVKDINAQDLLYEYAQRHRDIDPEFSADLEYALRGAGFLDDSEVADLCAGQLWLLEWLAKEDSSAYGECEGADLEVLRGCGLAIVSDKEPTGYSRVKLHPRAFDIIKLMRTRA